MKKKELINFYLEAAKKGDIQGLKKALSMQVDVNCFDLNKWTALFWAAYFNHFNCVKFLIEEKADVNIQNIYGYTVLCETIYKEFWDISELLLENGADVNTIDYEGNNTLMYFLQCKKDNKDIFQKILKKTNNLQRKNKNEFTAEQLVTKSFKEEGTDIERTYNYPQYYIDKLKQ